MTSPAGFCRVWLKIIGKEQDQFSVKIEVSLPERNSQPENPRPKDEGSDLSAFHRIPRHNIPFGDEYARATGLL